MPSYQDACVYLLYFPVNAVTLCLHVVSSPPCVRQASSMVAVGFALAAAGFAGQSLLVYFN